jgi:hypothetical protein
MFFGCLMQQPHPTPHKNWIIPFFCAVSVAAVASDTVKITVRVNTSLELRLNSKNRAANSPKKNVL